MPNLQNAYNWAIRVCNAPNIGYSKDYRNQKTVNGITYYDCSSFIWYALLAGGFDVISAFLLATGEAYSGNAIWTAVERRWLTELGFTEHPANIPWKAGDVLWREGHTEMAYDSERTMGAHTNKTSLDQQVSINSNPSNKSSWTYLYRYSENVTNEWIKGNRYLSIGEMQNNASITFSTMLSKGWSKNAIAGLLGNLQQESTVNPDLWQNLTVGTGGYGLAQWTPASNWTNWADAHSYEHDDGYGQLEWIDSETIPFGQWNRINGERYGFYLPFNEFIVSNESPEYLASVFFYCFEQANDSTNNIRREYARYWFDWFDGEYVPPPNPPELPDQFRKGMKIWMMARKL